MENVVLAKIVLKLMEKCGKTLEKFSTVKRKQPRGILPSWMSSSQLEIVGGFKASGFNPEECEPIVFIQVYPLIISINTRMCVYVCVYKYVYIYTLSGNLPVCYGKSPCSNQFGKSSSFLCAMAQITGRYPPVNQTSQLKMSELRGL